MKISMDEFEKYVTERFEKRFKELSPDLEVRCVPVEKLGRGTLRGITAHKVSGEFQMMPILYLEDYLEMANQGLEMLLDDVGDNSILRAYVDKEGLEIVMDSVIEEMLDNFCRAYENAMEHLTPIEGVLNKEGVLENVVPCLVNYERNKEALSHMPFQRIFDLAICYRVNVEGADASIPVNNAMIDQYGISGEELFSQAEKNLNISNVRIDSISDIVAEITGNNELAQEMMTEKMLVITNQEMMNGAIYMLNREVLDKVSEIIGGPVYILPSSIHEVIVISQKSMEQEFLVDMVRTINQKEVEPAEMLSDNIYAYDSGTKLLELRANSKSEEKIRQTEKKLG